MTAPIDNPRILIIEDSLGVSQALQRALGLYHDGIYWVESCESGETALKRLHEAHFDLLISDLRLPGISGLELLERARNIHPEIRTLLITAYGSPEIESRAKGLADVYLPKPFRLQELIRRVEQILAEPTRTSKPVAAIEAPIREEILPQGEIYHMKNVHLIVLACDLDGTLAEDGQISAQTWEVLRTAKLAGLVLILVTGRTLDSFIKEMPFVELCEAIVAENGAVIYLPHRDAIILPFGQLDAAIIERMETLDIPLDRGMAIAATWVPHDEALLKVLREIKGSITIEYNRAAVMVLPPGVTKGAGLKYVLRELGYSFHNVVACGDAENDRSLFDVSELAVAVSNAQPTLKMVADIVLSEPDGNGVQALIRDLTQGHQLTREPRNNRRLLLGHRLSGAPVYLDPFALIENNVGIFGSSGSGKSWLGGLLAEESLKQEYQICIIDPEGDYRGLGASPNTLLLGGSETALPSVSDVLNFSESSNTSLVLDLSMYSSDQRIEYVTDFLRTLQGLRTRRGRPHCFLVDEIQSFCPPEGGKLTDLFLESMQYGGFGVISYRISQIAPALLEALDHLLVTRLRLPEEFTTLRKLLDRFSGDNTVLEQLSTLPRGQAYVCTDPAKYGGRNGTEIIKFRVGPRAIPHIRHLHKYLRATLPEWKWFYFHEPDGRFLGRAAASLWEFRQALGEVSLESLQFHLRRGDFEHWLLKVLHDEELARRLHKISNRDLEGEALRRALLSAVIDRYEELEALI